MNKLILTLIIIIGLLFSFIVYDQSKEYQNERDMKLYQSGATDQLRIILQTVAECETFPITIGNNTITLVAAECLQQDGI